MDTGGRAGPIKVPRDYTQSPATSIVAIVIAIAIAAAGNETLTGSGSSSVVIESGPTG